MNRQEEYNKLIQDKQTLVIYTDNDAGEGERIVVADIHMKPRSKYANDYINPHQLFNHIPHDSLAQCPACGDDWVQDKKEEYYACASNDTHGKIFVHEDTYKRFASRYGNPYTLPAVAETESRDIENEEDLLALLIEESDGIDPFAEDITQGGIDPFAEEENTQGIDPFDW